MCLNRFKNSIKRNSNDATGSIIIVQAIVELAADTRKMAFRYCELCGKASDAADAERSAILTGFTFLRVNVGKIQ